MLPGPLRHPALMRIISLTLVAFALAGLLAACSGGGSDHDASASSTYDLSAEEEAEFQTALEFTRCLRDHGIKGLPDPQVSRDGFLLMAGPLVFTEEWDAAQKACQPVLNDVAPADEPAAAAGWERVVPGGDCQCSDGSEFSFWVREANSEKVVFFLEAGGGCFSAKTCAPDRELYTTTITEGPNQEGVFDFADRRNPFADYSIVYVPYCTGDVHIGNAVTEYASDLTIRHKGYVNGTAALDHLAATFPGATDVVVMGESAGSIAAPLYAGLVSDRLPDAKVTVLANGSGSYPDRSDIPDIYDRLAGAWGTADTLPPWAEKPAEQWSFPGFFIQSGRHDTKIVFARIDFAYDERQEFWYPLLGIPRVDLLSRIDANETQIQDAGVNLLSYIAPGDDHTVLSDGIFYTEEVNGHQLVGWVSRLIEGEPVADVHCEQCAAG
jgi:Pectinacetylesterase